MKAVKTFFADPKVRLAGRALAAAVFAAVVQIQHASDGRIVWSSVLVGAGLAFCEVFTPLNAVVGYLKPPVKPAGEVTT